MFYGVPLPSSPSPTFLFFKPGVGCEGSTRCLNVRSHGSPLSGGFISGRKKGDFMSSDENYGSVPWISPPVMISGTFCCVRVGVFVPLVSALTRSRELSARLH